jgi:hypothetical protein
MCCVSHCIDFNLGVIFCTLRPTVRPNNENIGNNKQATAGACTSVSHSLENILVTTYIGNHRQSYFNPGKKLPLTIRIYDRATWEYGDGGKFSFIVCQEMGRIASAFYCTIARERVKRRFLISYVSAGNITLCLGQHVAYKLQVERAYLSIWVEVGNFVYTYYMAYLY